MNKAEYDFRIDILKAFAIISVILIHALPKEFLTIFQAQFHIWQAVLVFVLLLGMNWGSSYLRAMDLSTFFMSKVKRLGVPLIIFTLISLCFPDKLHFDWALLIGTPAFRGFGIILYCIYFSVFTCYPYDDISIQKNKTHSFFRYILYVESNY